MDYYLSSLKKHSRESALRCGNVSLLLLLVCWVVGNNVAKPQRKDGLNLCCCFFSTTNMSARSQPTKKVALTLKTVQ